MAKKSGSVEHCQRLPDAVAQLTKKNDKQARRLCEEPSQVPENLEHPGARTNMTRGQSET